jgi:hypothetical protein
MDKAVTLEKRKGSRKRTLLAARIAFANGASTVDCVVRDRSADGARIRLGAFSTLPENFKLVISGRGEELSAHMVWSRGDEIGVAFPQDGARESRVDPDVEVETLRRRIRELENTVLALRNRVRELTS